MLQPEELPDTRAAEVVAIRYVGMIRYVMLHLKNQLSFLNVGSILLAISLNCYSFQGEGFFRWWWTTIFVLISSVIFAVFIEMERDAALRRLTDTRAGKVDSGFIQSRSRPARRRCWRLFRPSFRELGGFCFPGCSRRCRRYVSALRLPIDRIPDHDQTILAVADVDAKPMAAAVAG